METTHVSTSTAFEQAGVSRAFLDDLASRVACEAPASRESLPVRSPYTDEPIGDVPACDRADVVAAVERARATRRDQETSPIADRVEQLRRFVVLLQQHQDTLLDIVQLETGKSRRDAIQEAVSVPGTVEHYAGIAEELRATRSRPGVLPFLTETREYREPRGVVGVITPWNYPLTLALTDAIPALLAGNAVVFKPDERTPFAALYASRVLERAGVPPELVQVVTGDGATVGSALIETVDYIAFTGGVETGRRVGAQAGEQLVDCSLELGGKNPLVVLADADPERAARGAVQACFANAGQLCLAAERIYVHDDRYPAFVDAFVERTESLTLGATFDYGPDVGSLIGPEQLQRVEEHVEDAVDRGASILAGGSHRPDVGPYCFEPTILRDLSDDALAACTETFGPVVAVHPVQNDRTAIERANDTEFGLTASVWTEDVDAGWAAAEAIDAGMVMINDGFVSGWGSTAAAKEPAGDSGLGARGGHDGLLRFTRPKTIARQRFGPLDLPDNVPVDWVLDGLYGFSRLRALFDR